MDSASQNISFIPRLYGMVNDPSVPQIQWAKGGDFFIIPNPEEFAQVVLPAQFKHNNFASFVRQLNMYGFHKVADLSHLASSGDPRAWAFEHAGFVRNKPELLQNIHRKPKSTQKKQLLLQQQKMAAAPSSPARSASPPTAVPPAPTPEQKKKADLIIEEIIQTKKQQKMIGEQFQRVEKEREMLWREYAQTQKKLYEQQEVTKQVLRFLAAVSQQGKLPFNFPASGVPAVAASAPSTPAPRPMMRRLTDVPIEEEEDMEGVNSRPATPVHDSMEVDPASEDVISSFVREDDQLQQHHQQFLQSELNSFLQAPSSANQEQPDFVQDLYQFEDSYITPYCSMEEDMVRHGLNAPINWIPS